MLADRVEETLQDQISIEHAMRIYDDVQAFDDVQYKVLRSALPTGAWDAVGRNGVIPNRSLGINRRLFGNIAGGFCVYCSKTLEICDLFDDARRAVREVRGRVPYFYSLSPHCSLCAVIDHLYMVLMRSKDLSRREPTWRLLTR